MDNSRGRESRHKRKDRGGENEGKKAEDGVFVAFGGRQREETQKKQHRPVGPRMPTISPLHTEPVSPCRISLS